MRPKHRGSFIAITAMIVLATVLSACQAAATATPASPPAAPTKAPAAATPIPAAVGKGPTTSGAPPACPLLTKDEVEAAIGKAVVPEEQVMPPTTTTLSKCRYRDTASQTNAFVVLSVSTQGKQSYDAKKASGRPIAAVPGIGDDAIWEKDFSTLDVMKGQYGVGVYVSATDVSDPLKAAQTLAPKVLARLP